MKKQILAATLAISYVAGMSSANASLAEHYDKTVSLLEVDAVSSCIFFQLTGVTEANPVVANGVWFAIDKNQSNAKEMYAILLSVKMAGSSVRRVLTNGDVACGQARVLTIDL